LEVLRSQLIGLMQLPATRLVQVLNTPGQQLVRAMQAWVDKTQK